MDMETIMQSIKILMIVFLFLIGVVLLSDKMTKGQKADASFTVASAINVLKTTTQKISTDNKELLLTNDISAAQAAEIPSEQVLIASESPMNTNEVKQYIQEVFGPALAPVALCIAKNESGYRSTAKHLNPAYIDKLGIFHPATWDVGVFQINDVEPISTTDRLNPVKNIQFAYNYLYKNRAWQPWLTDYHKCNI